MTTRRLMDDDRQARVLTVAGLKGGIGRTTTAVNLAALFALTGRSILLIDLDALAGATAALGLEPDTDSCHSAVFRDAASFQSPIRGVPLVEGLDLWRGGPFLSAVEAELHRAGPAADQALERLLEPLRMRYDLIVIDAPGGRGPLIRAALTCADDVLLPLDAGAFGRMTVEQTRDLLHSCRACEEGSVRLYCVLIGSSAEGAFTELNAACRGEIVPLETVLVRDFDTVRRSHEAHDVLINCAPGARVTRSFVEVCRELMNHIFGARHFDKPAYASQAIVRSRELQSARESSMSLRRVRDSELDQRSLFPESEPAETSAETPTDHAPTPGQMERRAAESEVDESGTTGSAAGPAADTDHATRTEADAGTETDAEPDAESDAETEARDEPRSTDSDGPATAAPTPSDTAEASPEEAGPAADRTEALVEGAGPPESAASARPEEAPANDSSEPEDAGVTSSTDTPAAPEHRRKAAAAEGVAARISFGERPALTIVGPSARFICALSAEPADREEIPRLWARIREVREAFPEADPSCSYGIVERLADPARRDEMGYIAGLAVDARPESVPEPFVVRELAPAFAARLSHHGPIEQLEETLREFYEGWLPTSGYEHSGAPDLEIYPEPYDPFSADSVVTLWIPIQAVAAGAEDAAASEAPPADAPEVQVRSDEDGKDDEPDPGAPLAREAEAPAPEVTQERGDDRD